MSNAPTHTSHFQKVSGEDAGLGSHVDLLVELYDQSPDLCLGEAHELGVSRRAFLELQYVVGVLLGTSLEKKLPSAQIYEKLSDPVQEEIDPLRGGVGLSSVAEGYEALVIHEEGNEAVTCKRERVANHTSGRAESTASEGIPFRRPEGLASEVADAAKHPSKSGCEGRSVSLHSPAYSSSLRHFPSSTRSSPPSTSSGVTPSSTTSSTGTSSGSTSSDTPSKTSGSSSNTDTTPSSNNCSTPSSNTTSNNNTCKEEKEEGALPIESTSSGITGDGSGDRRIVLSDAEGPSPSLAPGEEEGTSREHPCGNTGRKRENRRGIGELSSEEIEALKTRTPSGNFPRVPSSKDLCEDIFEWQPAIKTHEPYAAICQHILFSRKRDEDWYTKGNCVGMPIPNELIFSAFGLAPSTAYNRGLNSTMLLELYRREVDPELRWSDWNGKKEKARVIKDHGIPSSIIKKTKELLLSPHTHDDHMYLIGREDADGDVETDVCNKREAEVENSDPAVDPPPATLTIQNYLNSLSENSFKHGGYGAFKPEKIECAIDAAQSRMRDEQRRDQELRKLYWIRHFPKPLHLPCDYSPRIRADRYNQAMNLSSGVRRAMYGDGDYELDLSKAHLASTVPIAKREGIDTSTLRDHLEESMAGEDLWSKLASTFSSDFRWDLGAARSAAKKLYAVSYGSKDSNILHEMSKCYGSQTNNHRGFEAFRPVLKHEVADEIRRVRDRMEPIINYRGGLKDAHGRFIQLSKWDGVKDKENRWRSVLAYVNATYEQKLMAEVFRVAYKERERGPRTKFRIWLYQYDGLTIRTSSKASDIRQIRRLQDAVDEKAEELEMPTELSVDYPT